VERDTEETIYLLKGRGVPRSPLWSCSQILLLGELFGFNESLIRRWILFAIWNGDANTYWTAL